MKLEEDGGSGKGGTGGKDVYDKWGDDGGNNGV